MRPLPADRFPDQLVDMGEVLRNVGLGRNAYCSPYDLSLYQKLQPVKNPGSVLHRQVDGRGDDMTRSFPQNMPHKERRDGQGGLARACT